MLPPHCRPEYEYEAIQISQFGDRDRSLNRACEIGRFCVSVRIRGFDAANWCRPMSTPKSNWTRTCVLNREGNWHFIAVDSYCKCSMPTSGHSRLTRPVGELSVALYFCDLRRVIASAAISSDLECQGSPGCMCFTYDLFFACFNKVKERLEYRRCGGFRPGDKEICTHMVRLDAQESNPIKA